MASPRYVETLLKALPAAQRGPLERVFDYVLTNLRLGRCEAGTRAENFQLYALSGTTHATPDTEFSIEHPLGVAPYLVIPILPLNVGAAIVDLTVTKAPDAKRIYLSSSVASAPIRILVEGV